MTDLTLRSARATLPALVAAHGALDGALDREWSIRLFLALLLLKVASDAADDHERSARLHSSVEPPGGSGVRMLMVPDVARFSTLSRSPTESLAGRAWSALRSFMETNPLELRDLLRTDGAPPLPSDDAMANVLRRLSIPALDFHARHGTYRPDLGTAVDALIERVRSRRRRSGLPDASTCLSALMVGLVNPLPRERIYDPLCHQGSLLIAAAQWAWGTHGRWPERLLGEEPNPHHLHIARLRLLLHGQSSRGLVAANALDVVPGSLRDDAHSAVVPRAHVALCRPPLSLTWVNDGARRDTARRFDLGVPPKQWAHMALIQHMLSRLEPLCGRMAIVVPAGLLFRKGEEANIRIALLQANEVETVIALPSRVLSGDSVATALMILRKARSDTSVLFVDARELAAPTGSRIKLDDDAVARIQDICLHRVSAPALSCRADVEEVLAAGGCLNVARYVTSAHAGPTADDLAMLTAQHRALKDELGLIHGELDAMIDSARKEFIDD